MNRHDHPGPTGVRRPGRRLILFTLILALAGCAGGGGGTDGGIQTGSPEVGVPAPPADSGSGASGSGASGSGASGSGQAASGGGPAVTAPSDAAPPTAPGDAPVDIEVGGPSLSIPGPPPARLQPFGEVATDTESAPRRFRLRSGSGDAVEVLALTVKGDGGFSLTDDQCTGAMLPPGGSGGCEFSVVFRPRQQGAATGELLVRLAQAGGGQVATGTGAPLATGRVALASATERTLARLVGHGTTAAQ